MRPLLVLLAIAWLTIISAAAGQPAPQFPGVLDEHPAIQYASRPTRDRVSALNDRISSGAIALQFQERGGYLTSVLDALGVPAASQVLVLSRTGIQRAVTGPHNPRALFFDEAVVVGYIPGARWIEVAAQDPEQGVVFYTIEQTPPASQPSTPRPRFARRTDCLTCHVSANTLEVPGMIHRSNFLDTAGDVMPMLGAHSVDHRTLVTSRWGGWFVTGNYIKPPYDGTAHLGNITISGQSPAGPVTSSNEVFIDWLNAAPETRGYPSGESDIAALMVFDHQMHAMNLLTRLNWESRVAASGGRPDFLRGPLADLVGELSDYLLFVDEAPPPGRVTPRTEFAERFTAAGPRDRRGRSLRELDLDRRLLRYPCSYMIYTAAFTGLPADARDAVYRRMWTILSNVDAGPKYAHLTSADRRAIVEILRDTKDDLPAAWR
jgi:hypothetical protein